MNERDIELIELMNTNIELDDFCDDMSGKRLNSKLVKEARKEEIVGVRKFKVYEKVPI